MPLVAAEQTLFPGELLEGLGAADGERTWSVAYTKVRQEKRLARDLWNRQIAFYLPLVPRDHVYRGRRVRAQVPLFGSYVFLYADPRERLQCLNTDRITHLLPVADQQQLYDDLVHVHRLIEANVPLTVESRLSPGDRVRVRHGCMAGIEGTVLYRGRQTRLVIQITFLQQGISVEIDDFMLERVT
ncbi:MAG: hypothetical protein HYX69_18495 [Planctomycetia bacterium]|nr:hypothetical protein [Planctomycetia bacterium]